MINTRPRRVLVLAAVALVGACADEATVPTLPSIALEGSVASAPTTIERRTDESTAPSTTVATTVPPSDLPATTVPSATDSATTDVTDPMAEAVTDDDLARFVAATETAIAGTVWAGAVQASAEIWVAVAQSACARFSAGESFEAVATDLVTTFSDPDPTDVERLVGAVLGAATRTICPEHADLV